MNLFISVMLNSFQHPTCGKPTANASCPSLADRWTLKQVQGDGGCEKAC